MCQHDGYSLVLTNRGSVVKVDTCLRAVLQFLNDIGIMTYDSCCGHGHEYEHITIGEEDATRVRSLGFRIWADCRVRRAAYPFTAVDQRVNIILPPLIKDSS